jgi:hypothetical protein
MSAETVKPSVAHSYVLEVCDFVFNFVFGAEVLAKQWGLYPQQYFNSRWNKFDFAVVMVSFFGVAIDNLDSGITGALDPMVLRTLRTVRVFRILRAFRIFKAAEGLQNLVRTLLRSLTSVGNLAALLLLLFFVVGVLAVELYAGIPMCDAPNCCALLFALDMHDNVCIFFKPFHALVVYVCVRARVRGQKHGFEACFEDVTAGPSSGRHVLL